MTFATRTTAILALFALLTAGLIACGGDDDGGGAFDRPPSSGGNSGNNDDRDNDDDGDGESIDKDGDGNLDNKEIVDALQFGAGKAVITLGDEKYEFNLQTQEIDGEIRTGVCRTLFGLIQAAGYVEDDPETTVEMLIPPTNWDSFDDERYDAPSVEISLGDDNWIADESQAFFNADKQPSRVRDWKIDGKRASGKATFVNRYAWKGEGDFETMEGTFEVQCADD
jgi:hypothetical protein